MLSLSLLFFSFLHPLCFHALPPSLSLSLSLERVYCIATLWHYHSNYGEQKYKLFYICCCSFKFRQVWWCHSCCDGSLLVLITEKKRTDRGWGGGDLMKNHTQSLFLVFSDVAHPQISAHFLSSVFLHLVSANITTATTLSCLSVRHSVWYQTRPKQ